MAGGRSKSGRGPASVGGGLFEAGPLSSGAQRLLDEERARGGGPRTKRTKARAAHAKAQAELDALRSRAAMTKSQRKAARAPRARREYPLTQRGLTALGVLPGTPASRKRRYTEHQLTQLASERRRVMAGLPGLTKEEKKARRTAYGAPYAEARAEVRAAKKRARARVTGTASGRFRKFTSAEEVNKEARELREQTALLKDQAAKERANIRYGEGSADALAAIAKIDARATARADKAQIVATNRANRAARLEAAAQGIRLPRGPRKPRSVEAATAARLAQLERLEKKLRARI